MHYARTQHHIPSTGSSFAGTSGAIVDAGGCERSRVANGALVLSSSWRALTAFTGRWTRRRGSARARTEVTGPGEAPHDDDDNC